MWPGDEATLHNDRNETIEMYTILNRQVTAAVDLSVFMLKFDTC